MLFEILSSFVLSLIIVYLEFVHGFVSPRKVHNNNNSKKNSFREDGIFTMEVKSQPWPLISSGDGRSDLKSESAYRKQYSMLDCNAPAS